MASSSKHLQTQASSCSFLPAEASENSAPRKVAIKSVDQVPDLSRPEKPRPQVSEKLKLKIIDYDAAIEQMKIQSRDATRGMIFDIEFANMEGIKTIMMLEDQDDQLDRVQTDLEAVKANMSEVQRDIGKMSRIFSCFPRRLWQCLPISKRLRSSSEEFESYRRASQPVIQASLKQKKNVVTQQDSSAHRLTNDTVIEDELDANLKHVAEGVDNLRHLAIDIHNQIMIQEPKINMLVDVAKNSSDVLGGAHKDVKKMIGE